MKYYSVFACLIVVLISLVISSTDAAVVDSQDFSYDFSGSVSFIAPTPGSIASTVVITFNSAVTSVTAGDNTSMTADVDLLSWTYTYRSQPILANGELKFRYTASYSGSTMPRVASAVLALANSPTTIPTSSPTVKPTATPAPTVKPTATPAPTVKPTATPAPTVKPTATPAPTVNPTVTPAPTVRPTTTPAPTVKPTVQPTTNPNPTTSPESSAFLSAVSDKLTNINSILLYYTGTSWIQSKLYTSPDMYEGLKTAVITGVAGKTFYSGEADNVNYGLVNLAAFLAQSMKETIMYDACDENNWSTGVATGYNPSTGATTDYPLSSSCGQLGQSYQDYDCEDACPLDPTMRIIAQTNASWYGAPGPLFCGPKSDFPSVGAWNTGGWCSSPLNAIPATYSSLLNTLQSKTLCKDYIGQKSGNYDNSTPISNCNPAHSSCQKARTDVENCCWWGRGIIQTTGRCNFGKLNKYLGEGAGSSGLYPKVNFCKDPEIICKNDHPELKWISGFFYWMNDVQPYISGDGQYNYMARLKVFVYGGMSDLSFIDGVSGIVNRGAYNAPDTDGKLDRRANFQKALTSIFGPIQPTVSPTISPSSTAKPTTSPSTQPSSIPSTIATPSGPSSCVSASSINYKSSYVGGGNIDVSMTPTKSFTSGWKALLTFNTNVTVSWINAANVVNSGNSASFSNASWQDSALAGIPLVVSMGITYASPAQPKLESAIMTDASGLACGDPTPPTSSTNLTPTNVPATRPTTLPTTTSPTTIPQPPSPIPTTIPSILPTSQPIVSSSKVVMYFTAWSVYDRNYKVMDMDVSNVTHINYAFANVANGECVFGDVYADTQKSFADDKWDTPIAGNFGRLIAMKKQYPRLKTLISVGGWTWSSNFSSVAATAASREKFATSCVNFAAKYGFDGIDIDWEFPVIGGNNIPHDKNDITNYIELLKAIRLASESIPVFQTTKILLTVAAPASIDNYIVWDFRGFAAVLDWINIMSYDFEGSWNKFTGHNAPLLPSPSATSTNLPQKDALYFNVDTAVQSFLNGGVPSNQLVVGLPLYGRGWTGVDCNSNNGGLYGTASGPSKGKYEDGVLEYSTLEDSYLNNLNYVQYWDGVAQVPYLCSTIDKTFISYDNPKSIQLKIDYIKRYKLGGAMFWEASCDRRNTLIAVVATSLLT